MSKTKKAVAQPTVLACSEKYRLSECGASDISLEQRTPDALGDHSWSEYQPTFHAEWLRVLAELVRSVPNVRTQFVTKYISDHPCTSLDTRFDAFVHGALMGMLGTVVTTVILKLMF